MSMPMLKSDLKSPKILWYQTDCFVNANIHLVDVKKYYLRIDRNQLLFSTIVNDSKYYVIINLFGAVIPEECTSRNTGREIKICIAKGHRGTDWLRLHAETEKNCMIIVDPDRINFSENSRTPIIDFDPNRFEEYKRIHKITNIRPDEPSSDEGGQSDDDAFDSYID